MRSLYRKAQVLGLLAQFLLVASAAAVEAEEKKLGEVRIDNEYRKLYFQMTQEEVKVREGRKRIKELIHQRDQSRSEQEKVRFNRQMAEVHTTMREAHGKLLGIRQQMKFRYPEKHDETVRRYYPERLESLDQMENEVGLEADLTQLRRLVQKVYAPFLTSEFKAEQELAQQKREDKARRAPAGEDAKSRFRLVK